MEKLNCWPRRAFFTGGDLAVIISDGRAFFHRLKGTTLYVLSEVGVGGFRGRCH